MTFDAGTEIRIDEKKLDHLKLNILKAEQDNMKKREKTTEEMIETIRTIIINEVKKNY